MNLICDMCLEIKLQRITTTFLKGQWFQFKYTRQLPTTKKVLSLQEEWTVFLVEKKYM